MYYIHAPRTMELPLSRIRTVSLKNWCQPCGIEADMLRLDELHAQVSGNKWFKLSLYLERARNGRRKTLLTFGGAWSNHILATAAASKSCGLQSIGLIRGEQPALPSATLEEAKALGMRLYFLPRTDYKEKVIPAGLHEEIASGEILVVPEGGHGPEGRDGASAISHTTDWPSYTHILCAVGTGTTLAGLIAASQGSQVCIGISVLKNNRELNSSVADLLAPEKKDEVHILHDFHEGGYARSSPRLLQFMNDWYAQTGIPSDFVYTGKLFLAADTLLKQGYFPAGSRLLLVHSGGLQGNRSLPSGTLIF